MRTFNRCDPVEEIGEGTMNTTTSSRLLKMGTSLPYITPAGVSVGSLDKADEIHNGAGRRTSAPVRKWFVRSLDGQGPVLSNLYSGSGSGGRSGYVSIKVLLSLIWKTSKPPFETIMTAPALAELLDLPDPTKKGARRVRDALSSLADANLIRMVPRPGTSPVIQLLNETGNGEEYTLPSTSYIRSRLTGTKKGSVTDPNLYLKLPAELWTEGFFQALKGPGLVMLLILLSEQAHKRAVWFSGSEFIDRYRVSPSTRTKGTQELVDLGMLRISSVPLPDIWGGSTFEKQHRRYEYQLVGVIDWLSDEDPAPSAAVSSSPKQSAKKAVPEPPSEDKPKKRKRRRPKRTLL